MSDTTTHLMAGRSNEDGTVTVTSVITLCCKVAFPKGMGTLDPAAVTCSGPSDQQVQA
ncbi:hypothetical protein [Microbacterium plantarum]|uniref:hypothetical protein n=1 Tax=Microbacterium plantarum TaxID=1816425 RepID=UPI002B478ED3|nr:hypothetical protein [Microbacterium plantarum]WRK16546.1 hypothetical protein VC184_11570 [Microbacterium plantarum]